MQHRLAVRQNSLGPFDDSAALGGETLKPLVAQDNRRTEFRLQLLDCIGQTRLGYVAMPGGPTEMLLLGERNEVFELAQEHFTSLEPPVAMRDNYQFTRTCFLPLSQWCGGSGWKPHR